MGKLKTFAGTVRAIDTRTVRPPPKKADADLLTPEHRQWANEVKRRAGYQCEAVENGMRCQVKAPARLFADHIVERRDGGAPLDPLNGRCLCGSHHTRKTAAARAVRLASRQGDGV
ncbi:HNH endonuclease signature motif containing protein [Rhizobium oryzicola]|uniref:HNH endonuclease signature motif containing protein n=1 Tax=Rhizobium oryzicola TaxID=1232668 RepID=A0ABT8SVH8_9HYPH|nr:HNH endonuclease signature motif containing protein [Rhizobium oryzicola]MDO1582417.1 HNH endonuclease signature motif containing protein [Rhizobium oryzicola]